MAAHVRPVRLIEIDWEDSYFSLYGTSEEARRNLYASMDRFGVLSPPVLWAKGPSRFSIVDGFKRFEWLRAHHVGEVVCRIHPEETPRRDLLLAGIETRLCGPPLNGAEKACIVGRLSDVVPDEVILGTYFPALKIPGKPRSLDLWRRLASSSQPLLAALASGAIHERAALELADWGEPGAEAAALSLLADLRCSASIQVEILDRLCEIAVRDGCGRREVLGRPDIVAVMNDPELHHRQKTQAVRDLLEGWRFPRLKARELEVQRKLEAIPMPGNVSLSPPPGFEGNRWCLEIAFSDPGELGKILQRMQDIASSSQFHALMRRTPDVKTR